MLYYLYVNWLQKQIEMETVKVPSSITSSRSATLIQVQPSTSTAQCSAVSSNGGQSWDRQDTYSIASSVLSSDETCEIGAANQYRQDIKEYSKEKVLPPQTTRPSMTDSDDLKKASRDIDCLSGLVNMATKSSRVHVDDEVPHQAGRSCKMPRLWIPDVRLQISDF